MFKGGRGWLWCLSWISRMLMIDLVGYSGQGNGYCFGVRWRSWSKG